MQRIHSPSPFPVEGGFPPDLEGQSGDGVYWALDRHYAFDGDTIETVLVPAVEDLWALCSDFVGRAVESERILCSLGLPPAAWDAIRQSWQRRDPMLYARFDLSFDGVNPPKMHECNADVVGHVYETAIFLCRWLEMRTAEGMLGPGTRAFAGLGPAIAREVGRACQGLPIRLLCLGDDRYDILNAHGLRDILRAGGLTSDVLRFSTPEACAASLLDRHDAPYFGIKFFRWDHFLHSPAVAPSLDLPSLDLLALDLLAPQVAAPLWALVLSSKGCLPWLWACNPGHPNLLPAYFDPAPLSEARGLVAKPLLSIRGQNIALHDRLGAPMLTPGPADDGRRIYQALHYLPKVGQAWASTSVFVAGGKAVALTVTEADSPIITFDSGLTVPHVLR